MRRPAFQFYPADWRNNANIRRCSWAARGVWVEIMCLMHDSDRYGVLEWPLEDIAQALGCPIGLVHELVQKGVLKGTDAGSCEPFIYRPRSGRRDGAPVVLVAPQPGPIWFSSRMVRDEYVRAHAGATTRFGASQDDTAGTPLAGGGHADASPRRRHGEDRGDDAAPSPSRRQGEGRGDAPSRAPSRRRSDGSSSSSSSSESRGKGISDPGMLDARGDAPRGATTEARPRPHRIPDDWRPPADLVTLARERGLDPAEEAATFAAHWRAEGTAAARKVSWNDAFRVWIGRSFARRGRAKPAERPGYLGSIFDHEPEPDGRPFIDHGEV